MSPHKSGLLKFKMADLDAILVFFLIHFNTQRASIKKLEWLWNCKTSELTKTQNGGINDILNSFLFANRF